MKKTSPSLTSVFTKKRWIVRVFLRTGKYCIMFQTCNVNITYFFIFSSGNFKKLITKTEKKSLKWQLKMNMLTIYSKKFI